MNILQKEIEEFPPKLQPSCATCGKLQGNLPEPLKRCAKCHNTHYCSRDCQKEDWKAHKQICGKNPSNQNPFSSSGPSSGRHNPGFNVINQFMGFSNDDELHNKPEKETFIQLIDCFRMRMEDEYTFGGNNFGIYGGESPVPVFRKFLNLAEKRVGLLPAWWNKDKRKECERLAMGGDGWANIDRCLEKSDVIEHYGNPMMPMQLRVLGEKIYGKGFM